MGEVLSAQGKEMRDKGQPSSTLDSNGSHVRRLRKIVSIGIEHHHEVHPPERRTNRDATTVGSWDTSRGSAQVWDHR